MISQEGSGWRLAWDPSRKNFPILLGGEGCAFELTEKEWKILVGLVLDLISEHEQVKYQLMEETGISKANVHKEAIKFYFNARQQSKLQMV